MAPSQETDSGVSRQRLIINNEVYERVSNAVISREQRSRVSGTDDPELKYMKDYKFDSLLSVRGRIRLLRLHGGNLTNPEITCEIFQVEYDKYHRDKARRVPLNNQFPSNKAKRRQVSLRSDKPHWRIQSPVNEDHIDHDSPDYDGFVEYEALSWCWGTENKNCAIRIQKGGEYYRFAVTKELNLALKHLRHGYGDRIIWIDALCIDQGNHEERNHQVQMMSRIYTGARQVCIWLGEDNDDSTKAIHFIREIMRLENFFSISEKDENASIWQSLLILMQRPWFSRRWVVQEIALAKSATIYCGSYEVSWQDFAEAVELFETAALRLSEAMRHNDKFERVPQWLEHVSELGASVLVQATGKVFRRGGTYRTYPAEDTGSNTHGRRRKSKTKSSKRTNRALLPSTSSTSSGWSPPRPLLSLEYLVSSLTVFEASQPRDAIYSVLAIARDTVPFVDLGRASADESEEAIVSTVSNLLNLKPFKVDYSRPYSDVCKDFISFCIGRSEKSDPTRALDILCRPWAPDAAATPGNVAHRNSVAYKFSPQREALWVGEEGGQMHFRDIPSHDASDIIMRITNPAERVGPPARLEKVQDLRTMGQYWEDCEKAWKAPHGGFDTFVKKVLPYLPQKLVPPREKDRSINHYVYTSSDSEESEDERDDPDEDIELPSWVSRLSGAPFTLYRLPGTKQGGRTGRQHADSLVSPPLEGHKIYSAAEDLKVDLRSERRLRFRKRPGLRLNPASGHCSLYTGGFILASIGKVAEPARLGGIPKTWTQMAGWNDAADGETEPPEEFWRTLVADRTKDNRNPPYYYATACKDSARKGGLRGGSVDTGQLISSERNSIIAEFCRRVQSVIWNRRLIQTKGHLRVLGLASEHVQKGDLVCILHGCTVPVILRQHEKDAADLEEEQMQDALESMKAALSKCEEACFRKERYRKRLWRARIISPELEKIWKLEVREGLREVNRQMKEWKDQEKRAKEEKQKRHDQLQRRKGEEEHRLARLTTAMAQIYEAEKADEQPLYGGDRSTNMGATGSGAISGGSDAMPVDGEAPDKAKEEDPKRWYKLIGEAYIHGMMDGEAVRLQANEELPMRMFEIR